jgi:hypothetical protein
MSALDRIRAKIAQEKAQDIAPTTAPEVSADIAPTTALERIRQKIKLEKLEQEAASPPTEEPGFFGSILDLFTGESRTTPEIEKTPEFRAAGFTSGKFLDDMNVTRSLYFDADDETKKDIIRKALPGVDIKEKDGVTWITTPDGKKAILNKPGLTGQDVAAFFGDMALFAPASALAPFAAGIRGASVVAKGIKSIASTLRGKTLIAGTASAGTELARQTAARQLGGEQPIGETDVATAGILGAGAEVAAPFAKTVGRKVRQVAEVTPLIRNIPGVKTPQTKLGIEAGEPIQEAIQATREADEITKKTGIPLFQAQKTLNPASLDDQAFLTTLSASSRKAARELKKQNLAAFDAVDNIMNTIAPEQSVQTAAGDIRRTARQAIDAEKAIRQQAASPIFEEAFKNKNLVKLPETEKTINNIAENFPEKGRIARLLGKVKNIIIVKKTIKKETEEGLSEVLEEVGSTARRLHGAKIELDDMIKDAVNKNRGTEARQLLEIKTSLLSELDAANPLYKAAREEFARLSPAIDELESSVIGQVAKLSDAQLKLASGKLFDPTQTNPAIIAKAKKIIDTQDPQAWRDITRLEFERRLGTIRADITETTTENVPGQLKRALFGNVKQRKVLYSGLDAETAKNVRYLERGLRRASLGRGAGSQTATREARKKELQSGIPAAIRKFTESPTAGVAKLAGEAGIRTFGGAAETVSFNQKVRVLADVMYNPKWQPSLKKLREINPDSKTAERKFLKILRESAELLKPAAQAVRPRTQDE